MSEIAVEQERNALRKWELVKEYDVAIRDDRQTGLRLIP